MGDAPSSAAGLDQPVPPGAVPAVAGRSARQLAAAAAVTLAYIATARLGFRLAIGAEQITTVWAPTGIALGALLLGGLRLWPAVWLGALVANLGTSAPPWTAAAIATGNTLEAVVAVRWLTRLPRFEPTLGRTADVLAFAIVAALSCTAISATLGVGTLCLAGEQPWGRFGGLWFDWWLGDGLGALVVAPAILTIGHHRWSATEAVRAVRWIAAAAVAAYALFGPLLTAAPTPLAYAAFPVAIAAAVSGGPTMTSLVVLTMSAVAIWQTAAGIGPFVAATPHSSLILLQVFMGVLAGTALLLAAAVDERRASERRERDGAAALRDRQEMLRLAQRAGGMATFEWDFQHQTARCSAEFFQLFGLPAEDGLMTGSEWMRHVHPEDAERMAGHLARAIAGAEPAAADYRIVAADGAIRWLTYAGRLQRTREGERMLGVVVDITGRKQLEADLRHHAAEIERILESIGEGFVALDRGFRYAYVNGAAEAMLGRDRGDLLGRCPWDVFGDDTVHASRDRLEQAMREGAPVQYELQLASPPRWFENRVYPSPDGLSIFFADVTARRAAETALRESRDVLALAMRGGGMGAWSRSLATNAVWWSRELEEICGLQPGEFAGTERGFFDLVHANDRAAVEAAVRDALAAGTDYSVEFRFLHRSGEWRWMEGRGRAIYDDGQTATHLYGIGIDITARKQSEIGLREAKQAAETANQLKDHFLATLSHELRTPLNAILGYVRMLRTNAIPPDRREHAIEVIERNALAQNQLVEDLLDMSRITTGQIRLDPQPVPVAAVLRDAAEGVMPAAEARGIVVTLDLDESAGRVRADRTRLQQVFWNVLTNAVKFTGDSGRVTASLRQEGPVAAVVVTDSGAGITREFLPFVFEPFRQGEARVTRAHGGLGLGLAITKQLVELHGGTIGAESPGPGQGATFTIRLPRVAEPGPAGNGAGSPMQ